MVPVHHTPQGLCSRGQPFLGSLRPSLSSSRLSIPVDTPPAFLWRRWHQLVRESSRHGSLLDPGLCGVQRLPELGFQVDSCSTQDINLPFPALLPCLSRHDISSPSCHSTSLVTVGTLLYSACHAFHLGDIYPYSLSMGTRSAFDNLLTKNHVTYALVHDDEHSEVPMVRLLLLARCDLLPASWLTYRRL